VLFINSALLLGALGILVPILIHLLNRRSSRVVEWGAMSFLFESIAIRNRRIQLEEALLMAARCLLVGLLALALARPFVPPGSNIPWLFVLPLILLGVVGLGVATVLHNERKWRFWIALGSILALLGCAGLIVFEKYLNLSRFGSGGRQDIALIIDGSTSMSLEVDGLTNFERAVEEARTVIKRAPRGHAFSLIVGGPAPSAKILDPTTDRAELEAMLDELRPLDGAMATYHALTLASLSLARGDQTAKQIILFTDNQNVGWETGQAPRWNFLRDAFKNLRSEPQIVLRKMPMPDQIRNIAITRLEFSREIVGTDRPVEIAVTIENTGDEAVTPEAVELRTSDGGRHRDDALGQMQPGAEQTLTFTHQFKAAGAQTARASLTVEDEIPQDNAADAALNIADSLKVLIVDGRASGRYIQRASTFPALALAPSALTLDPSLTPNPAGAADQAGDDFDPDRDNALDPVRFLVEPIIVSAPELASLPDFDEYDAILLADVARLATESATALIEFVEKGGGLLIAPGQKVQADFYNGWKKADGSLFLPAQLGDAPRFAGGEETITPSGQTLTHPAFRKISGTNRTDFATVQFTSWWPLTVPEALAAETAVGARLNTGEPLLAARRVGAGQVLLLGATLDITMSNLPTRQSFLPLIHELVYHLADPAAYDLNLDPGWDLTLSLSSGRHVAIGQGLKGDYHATIDGNSPPIFTRIDPGVQFNWQAGSPGGNVPVDGFRVEWTGKIQPPTTETYTLMADVDDEIEVWIDGKSLLKTTAGRSDRGRPVKLERGKWHDFRARFVDRGGEARAILYWESKGLPRQIIPPDRFRVFAGPAPTSQAGSREGALARYPVKGPDDQPRTGELSSGERGSLVKIVGDVSSGAYRLQIPEEHRTYFRAFLRDEQKEIPFTVKRDPAESHLTRLTEADFTFLGNFVTVVQPETLEEVVGILQGNQFGQELWKYLALGAFILLLVEIALARWIAISRRTGEEIKIDFESKDAPTSGFKEQLARIRATGAR
jgi:hypothetical protein